MSFTQACASLVLASAFFASQAPAQQAVSAEPPPRGQMVDLGGHRLHVDCRGKGPLTVVIENGFEEFSFDWTVVQSRVEKFTKICTYDRAGYAWSEPGPAPRTFDQINIELHDALEKLGEHGPFVLVGHAFGGPIVRNFVKVYPKNVAGIVFVDAVSEDQRFEMWNKAVLMRDGAKGKPIPAPDLQVLHLWAQAQSSLAAAEENERTWSPEYFARWHDHPEINPLGSIPLIVLSREHGGFRDLDISASEQETERKSNQTRLIGLSQGGVQRIIGSGEGMELEAPDAVVQAIREVVEAADRKKP